MEAWRCGGLEEETEKSVEIPYIRVIRVLFYSLN